MRPHSYPQVGRPGQFTAASAWPVNVTMRTCSGIEAAASEEEPGCGRTRGRCRERTGRELPLQRLPEAVPGAVQAAVRAPALARVPAWAAVAAGAGVPGAVQAVRAPAVARVPAGAPAVAGVPAAPAMVGAAATAVAPGAAVAARAAVAVAGPAAAPPVRGAPVPAIPASAGWDRRVLRPRASRERGSDLLPPWDSSRPGASYPRSGRVRVGGVHAGQGCPVLCATTAWASAARCSSQTLRGRPAGGRVSSPDEHVELIVSGGCCTSKRDAARSRNGKRGLRVPGTALPVGPRSA